jgi:hypothetical protein
MRVFIRSHKKGFRASMKVIVNHLIKYVCMKKVIDQERKQETTVSHLATAVTSNHDVIQ